MTQMDQTNTSLNGKGLKTKLDQLRIDTYTGMILRRVSAIERLSAQANHIQSANDVVLGHYDEIDDTYQQLIEGISDENQVYMLMQARLQSFLERCRWRLKYASTIENDRELALQCYIDIEDAVTKAVGGKYHGFAVKTGWNAANNGAHLTENPMEQLYDVRKKAGYGRKYIEVQRLIDDKDYPAALDKLYQDFLLERNFTYRDVARIFSDLVDIEKSGDRASSWLRGMGADTLIVMFAILIAVTSFVIGLVISNVFTFLRLDTASIYIPLVIVLALWLGALFTFRIIKKRQNQDSDS